MSKTYKLASALLLSLPLVLSACQGNDVDIGGGGGFHDPDSDFIVFVPAGGADFGTFAQFEHDFATRDIDTFDDRDGFTFSLAEESTVIISVTAAGGLDAWLDLYDGSFFFLQGDDNGGPGNDPVIVAQLPAGDYVAVVGGVGNSEGTYDFDIVTGAPGGVDFGELEGGTLYFDDGGFIDDATDFDSYYFTLDNTSSVDLDLIRLSGNYDGNLQLVNQFGDEILFIDPVGDADPSTSNVILPAGTYMLTAGAGSGSGAYEIQVNVD